MNLKFKHTKYSVLLLILLVGIELNLFAAAVDDGEAYRADIKSRRFEQQLFRAVKASDATLTSGIIRAIFAIVQQRPQRLINKVDKDNAELCSALFFLQPLPTKPSGIEDDKRAQRKFAIELLKAKAARLQIIDSLAEAGYNHTITDTGYSLFRHAISTYASDSEFATEVVSKFLAHGLNPDSDSASHEIVSHAYKKIAAEKAAEEKERTRAERKARRTMASIVTAGPAAGRSAAHTPDTITPRSRFSPDSVE